MKFYNRENELAELKRIQRLSFEENSRLTVITGRRRIGKTSLIMKAVDEMPTVYLFVGRKNEATMHGSFFRGSGILPTGIDSHGLFWYCLPVSSLARYILPPSGTL